MAARKVWCGSVDICNICNRKITDKMYDARTRSGRWGMLCPKCFKAERCTLGMGCGQEYTFDPQTKEYVKTGG